MYYGGDRMNHFIGIPDDQFIRGKVPMTKQEIRILTLAKAKISEYDIVLDIGAGTGSISIESALLANKGQVYALEKNKEAISLIQQNSAKFNVHNLQIVAGEAPSTMKNLPQSDVAFIGGSGANIISILLSVDKLLKVNGRLVINTVTLENLYEALEFIKEHSNYQSETIQVQVSRLNKIGNYNMSQALNPISIICCTKLH